MAKQPKNFHKISGLSVKSKDGKEFTVELGARELNNGVWVYPSEGSRNVAFFNIDWGANTFRVSIAERGEGTNFHTTLGEQPFHMEYCKSPDEFMKFILKYSMHYVEHLINKKQ